MNKRLFSRHTIFVKTLSTSVIAGAMLWIASESLARPGFGGGHFGGPRMNIHPGFAAGGGARPMRPIGGSGHRPTPDHGPRPQHHPLPGGGGDHHGGGGHHRGGGDHHHNNHHHGHYWPYPNSGYWAAAAGAAAATVIYSLPAGCIEQVVNGVVYQQCGGTWYRPSYAGSQVVYEVVPAP